MFKRRLSINTTVSLSPWSVPGRMAAEIPQFLEPLVQQLTGVPVEHPGVFGDRDERMLSSR